MNAQIKKDIIESVIIMILGLPLFILYIHYLKQKYLFFKLNGIEFSILKLFTPNFYEEQFINAKKINKITFSLIFAMICFGGALIIKSHFD